MKKVKVKHTCRTCNWKFNKVLQCCTSPVFVFTGVLHLQLFYNFILYISRFCIYMCLHCRARSFTVYLHVFCQLYLLPVHVTTLPFYVSLQFALFYIYICLHLPCSHFHCSTFVFSYIYNCCLQFTIVYMCFRLRLFSIITCLQFDLSYIFTRLPLLVLHVHVYLYLFAFTFVTCTCVQLQYLHSPCLHVPVFTTLHLHSSTFTFPTFLYNSLITFVLCLPWRFTCVTFTLFIFTAFTFRLLTFTCFYLPASQLHFPIYNFLVLRLHFLHVYNFIVHIYIIVPVLYIHLFTITCQHSPFLSSHLTFLHVVICMVYIYICVRLPVLYSYSLHLPFLHLQFLYVLHMFTCIVFVYSYLLFSIYDFITFKANVNMWNVRKG